MKVNLTDLIASSEALFGALVIVWGYVAKFLGTHVPALDKVKTVFKVLAGAVVLAAAFVSFGFAEVFPLVFSFLASMGVYDLFLKPLKTTK
jgi:Sec-independent protein secretion pathway component TatC